ncbi:MAG: transglutaminase family protein, partial [Planctomycetes bacterium]|nr:transglutaminase family protein [Planctomycetota bacterium]
QGKWYPGESLPRWAMTCYWRKDGEPIWRDPKWCGDPATAGKQTAAQAKKFTEALAKNLEANPKHVLAAFEDAPYYLWRERRLPVDVDPTDPKLADAEERARIARVFERGLDTPVGYVLPLQRVADGKRRIWQSGLWMLRAKHVFLVPGDSPVGLRLPMASLSATGTRSWAPEPPRDPFAPRPPLPPSATFHRQRQVEGEPEQQVAEDQNEQPTPTGDEVRGDDVRTALTVELREGRVHVFLPPVAWIEDFLDLIATIEDTAAQVGFAVVVEGYPAPQDPRIDLLKITPDPGVIEVNVHPTGSWRELVDLTSGLYEDARQCRLGTEKFLVDGRPMGTGGGNHVVVGAAEPQDSPFLRRPHLLRSMLSYWNNHPSLSYLFSSLFIGPTSQSPRIDEARHDSLRELEIAFAQLPEQAPGAPSDCPPWLVDRLFRHLLVDVSGNTHRTEFCIDKLYSPDSSTGRLGLLELRGFEMPPHARMSLAQQLLVRALIARFWETPYRAPLRRWGTTLHDRFLLPHFVRTDFEEVLGELDQHGFAIEWPWFAPQFEFRFPRAGEFAAGGVHVEVRHALEPWHVLGEEPGGGGTTRFVDSSLERMQVKLTGLTDADRYSLVCNGVRVPLTPTHVREQAVAGIRFRAWQPPNCLHPTIGTNDPLVFELYDEYAERAIGGSTYHVGHPGGRNHDQPPTTAYEAEGRRLARFVPFGHTPGRSRPRHVPRDPEAPITLDLRQVARGTR